jgi:hypothetical protein
MRCFELTDTRIIEGLKVQPGPDLPHINITSDGELYAPVDPTLTALIARASMARSSPIRLRFATVMNDGEFIAASKQGNEALVRVDVSAPRGGRVTLSASNDRGETLEGQRVVKCFGPFPSLGIYILAPALAIPVEQRPWTVGAQRLELAIVMLPGASFRISRSRTELGIPMNSYVLWTGTKLEMTRVQSHEQRPQRSDAQASV